MTDYTLDGRLGRLIARGGKLKADVAERVIGGGIELTTAEASQLTLDLVDDSDLNVLGSRLFDAGTPDKAGSRLDFAGLKFEVRAVEVAPRGDDHVLKVTARPLGIGRLKRARGAKVRKNLSPTAWVRAEAKLAGLEFVGQPSTQRKAIARKGNTPPKAAPAKSSDEKDTDEDEATNKKLTPAAAAKAAEKAASEKPKAKAPDKPVAPSEPPESSWDVIVRLAGECGFIVFEAAGVLYFGKPTWLVEQLKPYRVAWKGEDTAATLDALPVCRRSGDDPKRLATVNASLRGDAAEELNPGNALRLKGVPTFDGLYLVERVFIPFAEGAPVEVDAITPVDPEKVERQLGGGTTSTSIDPVTGETVTITLPGTSTGATGAKSAAAFVAIALAQAGDSYIYAAEADASNADPNAFDCSELVQWAAARAGVPFVDGSSAQIAAARPIPLAQGIATRGAILWHPGHIAISLGNGKTIEAANSRVGVVSYSAAGRFQRAGLIPGMRY